MKSDGNVATGSGCWFDAADSTVPFRQQIPVKRYVDKVEKL
jgi:hypothetical protein